MTTPFNPELHVFHRAQVGAQTPLPPAPAGRELVNVWRVLDEKALREHGLVHGKTAFLEDHGHDWKLRRGGSLRYSTRQAEPGQWLDVLLDYQTPLEARMTARTALFRFDPMTGQPLANPSSEPAMRPAFDPSLHVLHTIKTGLKQANDLPPPPEGQPSIFASAPMAPLPCSCIGKAHISRLAVGLSNFCKRVAKTAS